MLFSPYCPPSDTLKSRIIAVTAELWQKCKRSTICGTVRGSLFYFLALIFTVEDNGVFLRPDTFAADWSEE